MNQSPDKPKRVGYRKTPVKKENFFVSYWGIWVVLAVLFIFLAIKVTGHAPGSNGETEVAEAASPPDFGEPGYLGSKRCKDCHWREYDAWKSTLHSRSLQAANDYTVIGDFERNNRLTVKVTDKAPGLAGREVTNRMYRKDGKFFVKTIGPDKEFNDYEITNVIGIGEKQNYITIFPNGEMHVLPVGWDIENRAWVDLNGLKENYPGNGNYWSDPENIWQLKCGGCHVTGIKVNYDKENDFFNSEWADAGTGCEACHGPGSNHVRAASEYFDYEKETIVNPAKLPWRLRAMVCGQCHSRGASTAGVSPYKIGFPDRYGYAYGFAPGKPLYLFYVDKPGEKQTGPLQYNEWKESRHAKAGIMCTDCHNVHKVSASEVMGAATGQTSQTKLIADNLCMDCHKTLKRRGVHRIHTFGSCIACHMPRVKGDKHSHTFAFISPAETVKAGGLDKQPNSCNNCHHHKDTPPENLVEFLNAVKMADMPRPYTVHGR
ncbi:MAG TPA: hypothetical protein ENG75_04100 [Nitrospirae bacterium]|nr:cytochrome c552 [bacterium BMS3Bbin08]HDH05155.1 hypothetical protein [Nitrospirota bacterium]HDK17105.1 hypothetical protein [Nitrospirota bacterium]